VAFITTTATEPPAFGNAVVFRASSVDELMMRLAPVDELREVTDVVERIHVREVARLRVGVNRGDVGIAHAVQASGLVEKPNPPETATENLASAASFRLSIGRVPR
jgi:hypothetical protein